MKIEKIHHVAYRCRDAKETVLWYQKMLNMDFVLAIAGDAVPSTHEPAWPSPLHCPRDGV